jgi:hypothetical protein
MYDDVNAVFVHKVGLDVPSPLAVLPSFMGRARGRNHRDHAQHGTAVAPKSSGFLDASEF